MVNAEKDQIEQVFFKMHGFKETFCLGQHSLRDGEGTMPV